MTTGMQYCFLILLLVAILPFTLSYSKYVQYNVETLAGNSNSYQDLDPISRAFQSMTNPDSIYFISSSRFLHKFSQSSGEQFMVVGCNAEKTNCQTDTNMKTNISYKATRVTLKVTTCYVSANEVIYLCTANQLFRVENNNITLISKEWAEYNNNTITDGIPISQSYFTNLKGITMDDSGKKLFLSDGLTIKMVDLETGIISSITRTASGQRPISKQDGPANQTVLNVPQHIQFYNGYIYGHDAFSIFKINMETGWFTVIAGTTYSFQETEVPKSGVFAKNITFPSIRGFYILPNDSLQVISKYNLYQIDPTAEILELIYQFSEITYSVSANIFSTTTNIYKLNRLTWKKEIIFDVLFGSMIDGSLATNRKFDSISALTMNETSGDLLFSDSLSNYNVYKLDKQGRLFTVDLKVSNVSCWNSSITTKSTLTFTPVSFLTKDSDLYVANSGMHSSLQKFDLSQQGSGCFYAGSISPDRLLQQGTGLSMLLNNPTGLHCDHSFEEIYIADTENHRIVKHISGTDVQVIAGTGKQGYSGDGGLAIHAQLNRPHSVYYDNFGNDIYIADSGNHRIRKISKNGTISTILGTGIGGFNGDGLDPLKTQINFPKAVVYSPFVGVSISDTYNHRVRRVSEGNVTTILGTGTSGMTIVEDNPMMTEIISPYGLFYIASSASLFVADQFNHRILLVSQGRVTVVAGTNLPGFNGDGMKATLAKLFLPSSVIVADGTIFIADTYNNLVRTITGGIISSFSPKIGSGQSFQIKQPIGLCSSSNVFTLVTTENSVSSILNNDFVATKIGGNGDGMYAYYADINPTRMLFSPLKDGSMVISESNSNRVRIVDKYGIVSTLAGAGPFGFVGDKYLANEAFLASPTGIAYHPITQDLYVCDTSNNRVRFMSKNPRSLVLIDTIAGTGNNAFDSSTTDPLKSSLNNPRLVSTFTNGDIVIGDTLNNLIKVISQKDWKIRTIMTAFTSDMYISKQNIIYFSSRDKVFKLNPYCDPGYALVNNNTDCIPICFGLTGNLTCRGNGECISADTCKCSSGYTGKECEIPICYGIPSNESSICSNRNGTCASPNKCTCNEGFYGDECQLPICFSSLYGESCGGVNRGRCVHRNQCSCKDHFTGEQCEYRSCFGKRENDMNVCSGHGKCGSEGNCECYIGYSGAQCSDLTQIYALSITAGMIMLIVIVLVIVSVILGWVLYRRNRRDRKIFETELSLDERLLSTTEDYELSSQSTYQQDDPTSFVIPLHKLGMDKPIRRLGEGGTGSVFQTKFNGVVVAVKVFDLNNFNISEEEFRNEAILLSKIRNPNIITFFGVSSSPSKRYIVMECLDQSLEKFIAKLETKQVEISLNQKLKMLLNVATGLEYLHTLQPRKIIHRDLKPQNILLDSNASILKLCDLGLSKSISQGTISTITNQLGTFYYMAPEMFDIQAVDPTYATAIDIYSFSIIAWQLIFESKDPYIYNMQQVSRKLNSKSSLEQVTSYQLTKLICEKDYRPSIPFDTLESCREWCLEYFPKSDQGKYAILFELCQLIRQCWEGNPKLRPNIEHVVDQLQSFEQQFTSD